MIGRHIKKLIIGSIIVMLAVGGTYAYALYNKANAAVSSVTNGGSAVDLLTAEPLNGESTGRVNILIAGNSTDDPGHGGAALTDSIMVASIDMTTKKLTLISVPRDMWVNYNGSYMKLNAVYPLGGMDGLQSMVETMLGITINHRVLINYTAFKQIIDAVGGIDVTIASPDARGIYDPMIGFQIANGVQHLDGTQALLLARSRNDPTYDGRVAYGLPNGDFDRTMYQRKIMQALLTKLTSTASINVTTLPKLLDSFTGNVTSNLTAGQLRRVYDLSKQITSTESISIHGADDNPLLTNYTSYDGQAALIPQLGMDDYSAIQAYVATYLTATTNNG